jgi:hypothetical protein
MLVLTSEKTGDDPPTVQETKIEELTEGILICVIPTPVRGPVVADGPITVVSSTGSTP